MAMTRELVNGVLARFSDADLIRPDAVFDAHRRSFLPHVIDALPGGRARWGVLRKSGGSIPSDIVVDRDDIHYDVFSGKEITPRPDLSWKVVGTWGTIGPIKAQNPAWRWMSLDEAGIVPYATPDAPKPPADDPPDTFDLTQRVGDLEQDVRSLKSWAGSAPK
jgi:hypothetical protein